MITDLTRYRDSSCSGSYSPLTMSVKIGSTAPEETIMHEMFHHLDFISTAWGQNTLYIFNHLAKLVRNHIKISHEKQIDIPLLLSSDNTHEIIHKQVCEVFSILEWVNGDSYNKLCNKKLSFYYGDDSIRTIRFNLNILKKNILNRMVRAPYISGEDFNRKNFDLYPGLLHLFEARAQMGNSYYLIEKEPSNKKALKSLLSIIFGNAEAYSYSFIFSFATEKWTKHLKDWPDEQPNLWYSLHPIWLFSYVATSYISCHERDWGENLIKYQQSEVAPNDLLWILEFEHPFIVFNKLCSTANENWFKGDFDNFCDVLDWTNDICKTALGLSLISILEKQLSGLKYAINNSDDKEIKNYHLLAGVKSTELILSEPQRIISPQKFINESFNRYLPCIFENNNIKSFNESLFFHTLSKKAIERVLWGGKLHCGAKSMRDCDVSSQCFFDEFNIAEMNFDLCHEWFNKVLGWTVSSN